MKSKSNIKILFQKKVFIISIIALITIIFAITGIVIYKINNTPKNQYIKAEKNYLTKIVDKFDSISKSQYRSDYSVSLTIRDYPNTNATSAFLIKSILNTANLNIVSQKDKPQKKVYRTYDLLISGSSFLKGELQKEKETYKLDFSSIYDKKIILTSDILFKSLDYLGLKAPISKIPEVTDLDYSLADIYQILSNTGYIS